MKRDTLQVGTFEVNCSVLVDGTRAWIFDPGNDAARLVRLLTERNLTPVAIFLTHAHFDHIGGIPGLTEIFPSLPVFVDEPDRSMFGHPLNQLPPDYPSIEAPSTLCNLSALEAAHRPADMEIIRTPGHTPGGVCYHFPSEKLLLSGDTLFAGSVGRTDLPGGDMSLLMQSLEKLKALPADTLVLPGHGPSTTIAAEKKSNPFLR